MKKWCGQHKIIIGTKKALILIGLFILLGCGGSSSNTYATGGGGNIIADNENKNLSKSCFNSNILKINSNNGIIYTFEYDNYGNIVKRVREFDQNDDGKIDQSIIMSKYIYEYNNNGNIVKEVEIFESGGSYTKAYTYDNNENIIKKIEERKSGQKVYVTKVITYVFDNDGNVTKWVRGVQEEDGNIDTEMIATFTYKNGKITQKVVTWGDDNVYSNTTGNNNVYYATTYTYDNNGQLITELKSKSSPSGYPPDITKYTYNINNDGNILERIDESYVEQDAKSLISSYDTFFYNNSTTPKCVEWSKKQYPTPEEPALN